MGVNLDEMRDAGRDAMAALGLPITDAAFDLLDNLTESAKELASYDDTPDWDGWADEMADWPSGSGVISVYTAAQVQLYADLGAWQANLDDELLAKTTSAAKAIGRELSAIVGTVAHAMADAAEEVDEDEDEDE